MQALFETAAYMPHGYCLLWQPWLVLLYAGSDLLIFLSYSAIPLALLIFLRRRPDVRYGGLVGLFAAFILLCGLTHLVSIATLWYPVYPLHGLVKLVTGIVSATTAVVLFTLIPRLVAIPSPQQLERANARLVEEIAAHRATLARLQEAERAVEAKIERRTAELAEANRQLSVTSREALHRGANLSAVIMSLARETARRAPDIATFMERFSGRVAALAGATASMTSHGDSVLLGDVIRRQLDPMLQTYGERIEVRGPEIEVSAMAAQHFGLAVHELATNAVKHGALSVESGHVAVSWEKGQHGPATMTFHWRESGAPAPHGGTAGFGTRLLTIVVPEALHGKASRTAGADGLSYDLSMPLARIAPERRDRGDDASGSPLAPPVPA